MTSSKFKRPISLSLLVLAPLLLAAATPDALGPDEYFHRGATNYIFGKMKQAKEVVEAGLRQYTNDLKLQKLYEKLKQQEQQNQQQSKDDKKDEKKDDSKQDQQSKNEQKDQSKSEEKEKGKQENQKPESQSQDQKPDQNQTEKKENQSQQGERKDQEEKPEEQGRAANARAVQMTPQEAQRLLDTLRSDERTLIFTPRLKTNRTDRVFKDW